MYICHSFNKKETNAKAVLYHMENWGLVMPHVYEDNSRIMESDCNQIRSVIEKEKEILIILTPYLITDLEALIELDIIKNLFMSGTIKVFTFSYGIAEEELPKRMEWIKETEVLQIEGTEAVYEGICHMTESHLESMLEIAGGIHECREKAKVFIEQDRYLQQLSNDYKNLEHFSIKTKIVLIYTMYHYISIKHETHTGKQFYGNCIRQLFQEVDYYQVCGHTQLKIAEKSFLLLVCDIVKSAEA